MPIEATVAVPVPLPAKSSVLHLYQSVHLADAFAIRLPLEASRDPEVLARFIMAHQPSWIERLTAVRDMIVACFGLKTTKDLAVLAGNGKAERIGFFRVYRKDETEIVMGEDDKHLDFRLSLLCSEESAADAGGRLTVTTVVHCHNLLGRAYIFVIAAFHRMVVKASLRRAAAIGWPRSTGRSDPVL